MLIHITVKHPQSDPTHAALFANGLPLGLVRGQRNAEKALRVLKRELDKANHTISLSVVDEEPGEYPPMIIERGATKNRIAGTREHVFGLYGRQGDTVCGTVITPTGVSHGSFTTD